MLKTEDIQMAIVNRAATEIFHTLGEHRLMTGKASKAAMPLDLIAVGRSILDAAEQACRDVDRSGNSD